MTKPETIDSVVDSAAEYTSREFCRDVECETQQELDSCPKESIEYSRISNSCRYRCSHTKEDFILWLARNGYKVEGVPDQELYCSTNTAYEFHNWTKEQGMRIFKTK